MSRSLKEGEVEELKSKADIHSIISNYVKLKKTGKNYTGLCPFHKEKTPSFTVDTSKQLYHCFGCGEGGDVISFIEKIENMEFVEAVEFLAKKIGYSLKYNYSGSRESSKLKNRLVELNEQAKKYFNFILFNSKKGLPSLDYLKNRGFTEDILKEFEVGFSLDSWDCFTEFAIKRGYKAEELVQCGLAIESTRENGRGVYDRFRGRIMFPIEDIVGKTIGFGGRIISETSNTGDQKAKYINTPETRLYSKSKNIYRISQAKNHIVEKDEVLIVEGYTDVMALHQSGIKNVVASLGTALTSDQIKLLGRFTKNIVLVFDSDKAGMDASLKGMERLREYNERLDLYYENNLNIRVAVLEEDYDPADFIFKKGKEAFVKKIEDSPGIIDFTIDVIVNKYNISNLAGKLKASDHLIRFISTLSSGIIQEECIKRVAQKLNLKESLLMEEMLKKHEARSSRIYWDEGYSGEEKEAGTSGMVPLKRIEVEALRLIINGLGSKIDELLGMGPDYFRFEDTRQLYLIIRNEIVRAREDNKKINFPVKITSGAVEKEDVRKLYNYILFSEPHFADQDVDLVSSEIINNLKGIRISEEIEDIRKKMIEYEKSRSTDSGMKDDEFSSKYDQLYQRLIELEKERMNLRIN